MSQPGDEGPYVEMDGPGVWVPRTVPWREARKVAATGVMLEYGQSLRYVGKTDAWLLGFTRDCQCEEVCERRTRWDEETAEDVDTGDRTCEVPAWAFRVHDPFEARAAAPHEDSDGRR